MSWTLAEILAATGGELLRWGPGPYRGVSTDTRRLGAAEAFVALRGASFDGNEFVGEACARGAGAIVASNDAVPAPGGAAWIRVGDGLRALGDLAAAWRRRLATRVVGVTGSNGKTTTKEMIAAVLASRGARVAKSAGTENNLVGVPQTLLRLSGEEAFAVVEMGMNHPGEIWRLAEIARPDVGVITNVGPAHLEGLGSIANVAAAKEELALALPSGATLVVNGADPRVVAIAERYAGRKIVAGADPRVRLVSATPAEGGQRLRLEIDGAAVSATLGARGAHNAQNALLAAAVGAALGLDAQAIAEGLGRFAPPPMRLEVVGLPGGARILNDAYNANPASVAAALSALSAEPGRRIAVLGEMLELGPEAARYHREVGAAAAKAAVDRLLAVGEHAEAMAEGARAAGLSGDRVEVCRTPAEAAERLAGRLGDGDTVLVKGSRGARMEEVVRRLRGDA
jgi:UDP-N-acetylmuramoyl-tripeptide--D-alanyl-D-alanine ligase